MTDLGANAISSIDDLPLSEDRTVGWRTLQGAGEVVATKEQVVLSSAAAVEFAGTRPGLFSSQKAFDRLGSPVPMIPIAIDPPDHTRFRRLLDPFFSPKKMAERDPELRRQAGQLIDAIKEKGECDFIADLATPFPSQVFLTLFGLPLEDRDKLVQWKESVLAAVDPGNSEPTPESLQHGLELYGYLSEHITARRAASGGNDLLSQLIDLHDEGGMTDAEIFGLCFLFVVAGLDTVTAALGFAFANLAADRELRSKIVSDYSLIPYFIEEQLRVEGPVPVAPRVATEDVEVAGTVIPEGTDVILAYGSANRDPRQYDEADRVHLDKRPPHFAFGRGPHRCLGSHLARLELRIILEEWHNRIADYALAEGTKLTVPWPSGTLGFDTVPLKIL
jgi:cytochrome P450